MARRLNTDDEIEDFIARVIGEADHHGVNVNSVIKPLSDAVRQRLNLSLDQVEVYERNGILARTCWVTIQRYRYAFSYNYDTQKIELRERSLQGTKLYDFDNSTSLADIQREVGKL